MNLPMFGHPYTSLPGNFIKDCEILYSIYQVPPITLFEGSAGPEVADTPRDIPKIVFSQFSRQCAVRKSSDLAQIV